MVFSHLSGSICTLTVQSRFFCLRVEMRSCDFCICICIYIYIYIYIYKQISSDFNRRALVYFPYKFVSYKPRGLHSSVDLQSEFEYIKF